MKFRKYIGVTPSDKGGAKKTSFEQFMSSLRFYFWDVI